VSPGARSDAGAVLDGTEATLLDLVDNLLTKGVVLSGEVTLGLAGVDLVHLRLLALLSAVDRLEAGPREGGRG
jgi:hypothetical protein